jgi:transcriptional regulator PpsR
MEAQGYSPVLGSTTGPLFSRGKLGDLDAAVAQKVVAAGGDITLVIDCHGVIQDMAIGNDEIARDGAMAWLDQSWSDTVTVDSRHKIDEMLRDAISGARSQWREVNQVTPSLNSMMVRYLAINAGREGHIIAIGRDDRTTSKIQQRLLEAQQAMERDYSRLRDAEARYRLLFNLSGEGLVIVDCATRRIQEANPAADRLLGDGQSKLVGEFFVQIFDPSSQDEAASLLAVVHSASRLKSKIRLFSDGRPFLVSASLFRRDGATQCLARLAPGADDERVSDDSAASLHEVLESMPDAFVVTDNALTILTANAAFLDLVRIAAKPQLLGQSLHRFLGRASLDRNILLETLREHGSVRSFSTLVRDQFDAPEEVEVSAVMAPDGADTCFGFTFRSVRRRQSEWSKNNPPLLRQSVEQLTELVGRVKLKELVRETTDLVERLCIEAALELTKNNRASAAEVLGLSRQSLYSKMHRFGLGNLADSAN